MATFTLKLQEEPITIEKADGSEVTYFVRELNGRELESYLNDSRKNIIMSNGEVVGMKSFDGMYTNLLARCTYDEESHLVLKPDMDLWPASFQKEIFNIAQRISKLGKDKEDEGGNE